MTNKSEIAEGIAQVLTDAADTIELMLNDRALSKLTLVIAEATIQWHGDSPVKDGTQHQLTTKSKED